MSKFLDELGLAHVWSNIKDYIDSKISGTDGSSASGKIQWTDINGRPDLSSVSSMKTSPIVLNHLLWDESNQQTIPVEWVLADEEQQLVIVKPKRTSRSLFHSCGIECVDQEDGALVFECKVVPEEDVSINAFVFSAAVVGEEYVGEFVWWSPQMTSGYTPEPYAVIGSPEFRKPLYAWQGFTGSTLASNNACAYLTQDANGQVWCQIDLGKKEIVNGFRVMPEQAKDSANGFAFGAYDVLVSLDGENFETILRIVGDSFDYNSVGEFYTKMFHENVRARYIKWVFYKYVVNSGLTFDVTNNVFQNMQLSKRDDAT